jgi:DNA-binding Xre family transcriptional regulator
MAVTHKKSFHMLIDKMITNANLMEETGFNANIITRIKRDNYISLDSIEKTCKTLHCEVDGIWKFTPDKTSNYNPQLQGGDTGQ